MRFLLVPILIFAIGFPTFSYASKQEELQNQIQSRQQEIEQLQQEVAQHQKDLEAASAEKKTLQGAVQEIDLTRKKLSTDITLTQKKIDATTMTIEELGIEVKDKEIRIAQIKEAIRKIIRLLNEMSQNSLTEQLLGHDGLNEIFTDADQLSRVQDELSKQIGLLKDLQKGLEEKKGQAEDGKKSLVDLSNEIKDQKALADQKRQEQAQLLIETKNKEANYKKLLTDKQARIKQFSKDIEEFENQLRIVLDPNSIPKPGTKALSWPLDSVLITQKFGSTQDSKRLYTTGSHNGVDFRATVGTQVKAAGSGVVVDTGDTDATCKGASYGRWVLIRHNNGLSTLYGHLSLARVSKGEQVTAGNTIGYSGNTGYSTGPHLHFTVFASAAVRVEDLPSSSCRNAIYHLPVAPRNGYLDPEAFLY